MSGPSAPARKPATSDAETQSQIDQVNNGGAFDIFGEDGERAKNEVIQGLRAEADDRHRREAEAKAKSALADYNMSREKYVADSLENPGRKQTILTDSEEAPEFKKTTNFNPKSVI